MGTDKKKPPVDDLFDDLADSFFRAGESGGVSWDDLELPVSVQIKSPAPASAAPVVENLPPEPQPVVQPAAPTPPPEPPVPAPVDTAPSPFLGAGSGAGQNPFSAPTFVRPAPAPTADLPPMWGGTRPATPPSAAPVSAPPPVIPAPALRPADADLFSSPTLILPAARKGGIEEDYSDPVDVVARPASGHGKPQAADPAPSSSLQGLLPSDEEHLFKDSDPAGADVFSAEDEAFFGASLDSNPFDQPTMEMPTPPPALPVTSLASLPPVAAPPAFVAPEALGDELGVFDEETRAELDDDEEASAENFVDLGPEHSLVFRIPGGNPKVPNRASEGQIGALPGYEADEIALARAERQSRREVFRPAVSEAHPPTVPNRKETGGVSASEPAGGVPPVEPVAVTAAPPPAVPLVAQDPVVSQANVQPALSDLEDDWFDEPVAVAPAPAVSAPSAVESPAPAAPPPLPPVVPPPAPPGPPAFSPSALTPAPLLHQMLEELPETDDATELAPREPEIPVVRATPAETLSAIGLAATPDLAPEPTLPDVSSVRPSALPADSEAAWRESVGSLEREAACATPEVAAALYSAAGLILHLHVGDWRAAGQMFERVVSTGASPDAAGLRAWTDVLAEAGETAGLQKTLVLRAEAASSPVQTAELLQDAALVAWSTAPTVSQDLLERSLALLGSEQPHPALWFGLKQLSALLRRDSASAALSSVLLSMAALSAGPQAARLLAEVAGLEAAAGAPSAQVIARWHQVRAADPTSLEAFLAIEALVAAAGDLDALLALYASEAQRTGEKAWWAQRSVRAAISGNAPAERIAELWQALLQLDRSPEVVVEHQAWLESVGDWTGLAEALRDEAAQASGRSAAWANYRLALLLEHQLGDNEGAIVALQAAELADPTASPAAEALGRLLSGAGRHADLAAFLEARLGRLAEPELEVPTLFRLGEICERRLGWLEPACRWYERILDLAPGYLPAIEGLERLYPRVGAWAQLADLCEQRSFLADSGQLVAFYLHRAAEICEQHLGDPGRALTFAYRALEAVADYPPALDCADRLVLGQGGAPHEELQRFAGALRTAAERTQDGNAKVSLLYRAARVSAEHLGDNAVAIRCLKECVELSPGFLPALSLLRDLSTQAADWGRVYELNRIEAEATAEPGRWIWRMLAAALAAEHSVSANPQDVLREIPGALSKEPAARSALARAVLLQGDRSGWLEILRASAAEAGPARAEALGRLAQATLELGDERGAVGALHSAVDAAHARSPQALAALAWRLHQPALGAELAGESDPLLRARLLEAAGASADVLVQAWENCATHSPEEAATARLRATTAAGDRLGMAEAHLTIARSTPAASVAGVHALHAGRLFQSLDESLRAEEAFRLLLEINPGAGRAFEHLRTLYIESGDSAALVDLYQRAGIPGGSALALDLEAAGDLAAAARLWGDISAASANAAEQYTALIHLERAWVALGDWRAAFEALGERSARSNSPEEVQAIAARRRWILANKLADSDEAWDLYRQLHREQPGDREVLQSLARIAEARGESALALGYLGELANVMEAGEDASRLHREIAGFHQRSGDTSRAREAYERALAIAPADLELIHALRELVEREGDWRAVVGLLAREAGLVSGEARLAVIQRIAETWEGPLGEPKVAFGAWQKVLQEQPKSTKALDRLVVLSRELEDGEAFVSYASEAVKLLDGAARSELLNEIGQTCERQLFREEDALKAYEAASSGSHPNLDAARHLERIYFRRSAWDRAIDAIQRQLSASPLSEHVALLQRVAQLQIEQIADRGAAAATYARILAIEPSNATALSFRAEHCFASGDLAGAVEVFGAMEEAQMARDMDDFDDRVEVSLYFFRFAEALRRLNRTEEAMRRYGQCLELNPSHLPSLEAVGPLYLEASRWVEAMNAYRQILQLTGGQGDPERLARTYTNLGRVELHLGNLDKARKRFNLALELRPNDIKALQGVGAVLLAQQNWNALLNVYNNIIYHAQEPAEVVEAYLTKGWVLDSRLSLPDKAAQHYKKSLAFDPNQPGALLRLSELSLRSREWAEALELAQKALALNPVLPAVRAGLHLSVAIARANQGDGVGVQDAWQKAVHEDSSLAESLGLTWPGPTGALQVLSERLRAQL